MTTAVRCGLIIGMLGACQPPSKTALEAQLLAAPGVLGEVAAHPDSFRLQVMATYITRDTAGQPVFTTETFRTDAGEYFYPASTVKFPVAVLALEKCRDLGISPTAPMLTDSAAPFQSPVYQDSTAESGYPSVAHYLKKIFLVSDNDAFNRLYEFVGPAYIHQRLGELGYPETRIVHRLSIPLSREQNQQLNPITFLGDNGDTLLRLPARTEALPPPMEPPVLLGQGERRGDSLRAGPKDFSDKNAFPIAEQHRFLRQVMFPSSLPGDTLRLLPEDRALLHRSMAMLPYQSDFPAYDRTHYFDSYVKFFLYGDDQSPMPGTVRIYNKVGLAYGFLTDNAYIVDEKSGAELMLTATLWCNANRIFNDDVYEYDEVGLPFLAQLGELMLAEAARRRQGT